VEHAFTGRDAGTIRVVFERTAATLRLEIADDGVGLPEDFVYDSMANLGLSIVRTLAESELGGSFTPASSDEGTTFTLVIPLP
jgi:two-component sensor histidine kinase